MKKWGKSTAIKFVVGLLSGIVISAGEGTLLKVAEEHVESSIQDVAALLHEAPI